jgi:hypothetical protein
MASYINRLFNTPFFQNKFVLYGSLFIVLLSILRHLANRNVNAVILMALIGLVMSYFSKNMIIVLLTAFASVFLLEMVGSRGAMEGMETKKGAENNDDAGEDDDEKDDTKKPDAKKDDAKKPAAKKADTKEKMETVNTEKGGKKNTKQGMTKLSPASYDGKDGDDSEDTGSGGPKGSSDNRIDYASTLEQAYDNIENIIGEEGVRGLTDQTKSLMNQQKQLMDNMKDMGPLLKSAEGFMKQVTGGGGIGGITEMLKGFATPGGKPAAASSEKK